MPNSVVPGDRRRSPRLRRLVSVSVRYADREFEGVTLNVSPSGFYVTAPSRTLPPAGALIELRPAGAAVVIAGRVRRVLQPGSLLGDSSGFSVELEGFKAPSKTGLITFLRELGADDAAIDSITETSEGAAFRPPLTPGAVENVVRTERLESGRALPDTAGRVRSPSWDGKERRQIERLPTHIDVRWHMNDLPHSGRVLNVSRGSVFLQTEHALPAIGMRIRIDLPLPDAPGGAEVHLSGTITRHWAPENEALPGVGVSITNVDERRRLGVFNLWLKRLSLRQRSEAAAS